MLQHIKPTEVFEICDLSSSLSSERTSSQVLELQEPMLDKNTA